MIRTAALVFAALAACIVPAAAQSPTAVGDNRPILKAVVTVSGDVVRIGDLIDNAGIVAKIPVFRAPDVGTTGAVSAAQVIDAVRVHGLVGLNAGGLDEIRVTRASRAIPIQDIEAQIASSLAIQYGLGERRNIALRFDRGALVVHVDATATGELQTAQLGYEPRTGRFDALINIGGAPPRQLRFSGTVVQMAEVVTLTRSVARGNVIKQSDVAVERRVKAEVGADALTSTELAVGHALRNAVAPGRPLRTADVGKAELVQRNEIVTIVYEVPGITLTARGKANEAGAEGDVIEVLNVQSKRNVHGVITGPGRVLVSALTANAIATSESENSSARPVVR